MPRYKVITGYEQACPALARYCDVIDHHQWIRPLDLDFLKDFFAIPAQSSSLFPGETYEIRLPKTMALLDTLSDFSEQGKIVWRMASGVKAQSARFSIPSIFP